MLRRPRPRLLAVAVLVLAALGAGCDQGTPPGQSTPGVHDAVRTPEPIPTVEPTCLADQPRYASARDLVARADLLVRVTATGPSRDHDSYPLTPAGDGTFLPPGAGRSPEEWEALGVRGTPISAISVRVEEVLKGAARVGDVIEVNQGTCTARPLPVGQDVQYLMALESYQLDPDGPHNQLNDSQATWQVASNRSVVPVDPDDDLGITTVDQLAGLVT